VNKHQLNEATSKQGRFVKNVNRTSAVVWGEAVNIVSDAAEVVDARLKANSLTQFRVEK
jgi:hypothetical protein